MTTPTNKITFQSINPRPTLRSLYATKRFLILFTVSLFSSLAGAQTVHMIFKPDTRIPILDPDFIGLDKERQDDEKAFKIIRGEAF